MENPLHIQARHNPKTLRVLATFLLLLAGIVLGFYARGWLTNLDKPRGVQWDFVEAARTGDVTKLELLLGQGAIVDNEWVCGGVSGFPALVGAVDALQVESVEWLLEHGADPYMVISDGQPRGWARNNLKKAQQIEDLMQRHDQKRRAQDEQDAPSNR
jgi:hypothetical protein